MSSDHSDQKRSGMNPFIEKKKPGRRKMAITRTEQKTTRASGQLDTVHYKAIFDSISDAAILTDSNRRIVSINPAAEKFWGYCLDEIRGRSSRILYADEGDYEKQGKLRYHAGVENLLEKYELCYRRKNGEIFYAETMAEKIETEKRDLIGFMVVLRDVTARKKMEDVLLHSKKEWERTFDSIANWISLLDAKSFRILRSNLAGEKLLGLPLKDILGKT